MKFNIGIFLAVSLFTTFPAEIAIAQRSPQDPHPAYGTPAYGTSLGQPSMGQSQGSQPAQQPPIQPIRRSQDWQDTPWLGDAIKQTPRGEDFPFGAAGPTRPPALPASTDLLPTLRPPTQPFGASLFQQQFLVGRSQGVNPDYRISPGDQILVNIWGARTFSGTLTVDLQGNVFLPEVGPVTVGGLANRQLNETIRSALRRVYTDAVDAYTNLLNTQPVSVFVTGAVPRPGRYPGDRFDSLLYFLSQAGGPDPIAGSYRNITVRRGNQVLAHVDLYDFLLNGNLPILQFADNDTIVVAPKGATVEVLGEVRNSYVFEVAPRQTTGGMLMRIAQPFPAVSHAAIRGVRDGKPYTAYLPLESFAKEAIEDGDSITFHRDRIDTTMFVSVVGQSAGPSSFAVPRGAVLDTVLREITIDAKVANVDAIFLRRKSVAERQQRALETAMQELQRSVLTTSSSTDSQAAIRVQEAQLVERFIAQVRNVRPEGRVVLANVEGSRNIRLEPDDEIVIPQWSDVVLISGEVRLPQSIFYKPGKRIADYIVEAGGYTERSDQSRFVILRQNGAAEPGDENTVLQRGDHVMVLPRVDSKGFAIFKDIVEMVYRIALSTAVVIRVDN
jgi:protein involved in polysaccharide export with SLBB domain